MLKANDFINTPSPLQRLDLSSFGIKNHQVWVKRDDLIHSVISGNKWRKLKLNIDSFLDSSNSHIISMGGAFSNHLLAVSYICNRYKIRNTLFVRGEKPKKLNDILIACERYNTNLVFLERKHYSDKAWVNDFIFKNYQNSFFIPEGGANELGILGCAKIIEEIEEEFDEIYCEVGTGATFMGIEAALKKNQNLIGVVVLKGAEKMKTHIENEYQQIFLKKINPKSVLVHDYHMGGYAKNSSKLIDFMRLFYLRTGIKTDPIYSGKLFYALVHQLLKENNQKQKKIIALHSGGLAGINGFEKRYKLSIFSN